MIRIVAFLLALLLAPLTAQASTFDSYILALNPTDYWSLAADANDQGSAAINGTCTGTCTYGQSITTFLYGYVPGTSSSYITVNQTFASSSQTIQIGAFLNPGNGVTTTQYITNQTGSISNSINLHYSDSGCTGQFDVVVIIGGSYTVTCMGVAVDDGNGHFFYVRCGGTTGVGFVDGVQVAEFTCAFSTPLATSYTIGNATSGYPALTGVGAVMYWIGSSNILSNWQLQAITSCGVNNNCPAFQPAVCPSYAGFQQQWCETWAEAQTCNTGNTSTPWWAGSIGSYTTALNSFVASIATTTTNVSSFVTGAPIGTQQYIYDNSTPQVDGGCYNRNTYVHDGTYVSAFGTGTGGNGTYTTAPSNTSVAIEPMQTGNWLPYTYLSRNVVIGSDISMVVGQGGGGGGSGGVTARGLPTPMTVGTEEILDFYGWFRFSGFEAWDVAAFGFGNQANAAAEGGVGQLVSVVFGNANTPPPGYVNLAFFLPITGGIGNINVPANFWHHYTLKVNYQSDSSGFVQFYEDGVLEFTWSGVTAPSGALTADEVFFTGQETGVYVDAEAYFGLIGAYAPGGGSGPMTLWIP